MIKSASRNLEAEYLQQNNDIILEIEIVMNFKKTVSTHDDIKKIMLNELLKKKTYGLSIFDIKEKLPEYFI